MKWGYLIIVVLFIFLFVGGPGYYSERLYKEIWETGHVLLFALSIFVLLQLPTFRKKNQWITLCLTTLFCLVAGVITETLQPVVGRSFEIKDLLNDILGGCLGWAVAAASNNSNKILIRISMIPAILVILFFAFKPVYRAAINSIYMEKKFPVLSDFETPFELDRWNSKLATIHLDANYVRDGEKSMRIEFDTGIYPGISVESFQHNWFGYKKMQFSLYHTGSHSISINLKVYDRQHISNGYAFSDRFNRTLMLMPGWNDFNVSLDDIREAPKDRDMDLSNIASFSLFLSRLDSPMTLYFDDLRLSRE